MISMLIPVYNEESSIKEVLCSLEKTLKEIGEYEIIVINDGSTDSSKEKIEEAAIEHITIIDYPETLGYGHALSNGILKAKYDCIGIIDGDGSYPVHKIKELYAHYPEYDMVVGARRGYEYKKGIMKKPARILFNYLVEYASGRSVPDVNSGLRLFKKNIALKYIDSVCSGFSFTTTLTLAFLLNHYHIKYVPINYLKRQGKSKVRHFQDTLRAGQIIIESILYYNPVKLFLLISTINLTIGIILATINKLFFHSITLSITAGFCIASFMPIFCLGLLADQLKKLNSINPKNHI